MAAIFTVDVRPAERIESVPSSARGGSRTALAIAPDGTRIVCVGRTGDVGRLYLRPLDSPVATELAATEGAESPTFSPDGRWIAFWSGGNLMKVPTAGGPVTLVCRIRSDAPSIVDGDGVAIRDASTSVAGAPASALSGAADSYSSGPSNPGNHTTATRSRSGRPTR